jgi:hypothetical protein
LLAPLSKLAEKHNVAIVCVSHLNKSRSNDALSRVTMLRLTLVDPLRLKINKMRQI